MGNPAYLVERNYRVRRIKHRIACFFAWLCAAVAFTGTVCLLAYAIDRTLAPTSCYEDEAWVYFNGKGECIPADDIFIFGDEQTVPIRFDKMNTGR